MQNIKDAKSIIKKLNINGYEAYLVGGCVRDYLLNKTPNDFDIATSALPYEVEDVFVHTIPTGKAYGTISVKAGSEYYEVTTYRLESEYTDSRRPETIRFSTDLKEDLMRRDFTINALAMDLSGNIIDYYGGRDDLEDKLIRCVGDPINRFNEDSLRKLRAIRFAAQNAFEIEKSTLKSIVENPSLKGVSAERIQMEFSKIILSESPSVGIKLLLNSNLLKEFLPELLACVGFKQNNKYHVYDVFNHLCSAIDNIEAKLELRLSALLHDIGKPESYSEDENAIGHFIGHEKKSVEMTSMIISRLRYPSKIRKKVVHLIKFHMTRPILTDKAIRKYLSKLATENVDDLMALYKADSLASNPDYHEESLKYLDELKEIVDKIINEKQPLSRKDLMINGRDLLERYDYISGSEIGKILNHLLSLVIANPDINTRDELLKAVDIYMSNKKTI